jgi:hypothetical protein
MGDCMTIGAIQANPAGEYTGGHGWAPVPGGGGGGSYTGISRVGTCGRDIVLTYSI